MKFRFVILLAMVFMLWSAHSTFAQGTVMDWTINGVKRQALVFAPKESKEKAPLVFAWHGHGGNMQGTSQLSDASSGERQGAHPSRLRRVLLRVGLASANWVAVADMVLLPAAGRPRRAPSTWPASRMSRAWSKTPHPRTAAWTICSTTPASRSGATPAT